MNMTGMTSEYALYYMNVMGLEYVLCYYDSPVVYVGVFVSK